MIEALSRGGRSDVIYDLLVNPEAPSYAAQLARGATPLTEAWDADPRSSQNHFMLGHAQEWFYRYLAGIDFDLSRAPEERIVLRPTLYDALVPPNTTAKLLLPSQTARELSSGRHHFGVR